jgi:adenine phosphoribosyltransferase
MADFHQGGAITTLHRLGRFDVGRLEDAVKRGQKVMIVDDLIATGGTAVAAAQLVEELGGKVAGFAFVIELAGLKGADRLRQMGYKVESLVVYD